MIPPAMPPWTPSSQPSLHRPQRSTTEGTGTLQNKFAMYDDGEEEESLSSHHHYQPSPLVAVPSPYSPPPSSLFSDEDFPEPSTARKAVRQSRSSSSKSKQYHHLGTNGSGNRRVSLQDLSLNNLNQQHQNPLLLQQHQQRLFTTRENDDQNDDEEYTNEDQEENDSQRGPRHNNPHHQQKNKNWLPSIHQSIHRDLEDSHTKMQLLQQENKALSVECDRFQDEIVQWRQRAHENAVAQQETLQQHVARLQQDMERQTEALQEEAAAELRAAVAAEKQKNQEASRLELQRIHQMTLEAEKKFQASEAACKHELQSRDVAIVELQTKLVEQQAQSPKAKAAFAQKVAQMDAQIQSLREECQSHGLQKDRLQAMLREANQRNAKQLETVQAALEEATNANQTLKDGRAVQALEWAEKESKWKEQSDRLEKQRDQSHTGRELEWNTKESQWLEQETKMQSEMQGLQAELEKVGKANHEERNCLQAALADATERENKWLAEKEVLQKDLENKGFDEQKEIDRLQEALGTVRQENDDMQSKLQQKIAELVSSDQTLAELRAEKLTLIRKTHRSNKSSQSLTPGVGNGRTTNSEAEDREAEIHQLRSDLQNAQNDCDVLRSEKSELVTLLQSPMASRTNDAGVAPSPAVFHFNDVATAGATKDGLINDRLGRIRDAAERAAIAKESRREFSRIKAEHDAEIKRLMARHDQDLRDVLDETKSEVSARARETRRRLQAEYDTKLAHLERKYQAELARVRLISGGMTGV